MTLWDRESSSGVYRRKNGCEKCACLGHPSTAHAERSVRTMKIFVLFD
jgi:hypothetical protein